MRIEVVLKISRKYVKVKLCLTRKASMSSFSLKQTKLSCLDSLHCQMSGCH